MLRNKLFLSLFALSSCAASLAAELSPAKIHTLYTTLDPLSISQHLAFYQLYPNTPDGQEALKTAYNLLSGQKDSYDQEFHSLPSAHSFINAMVAMVNKQNDEDAIILNESDLKVIERLAGRLPNRKLRGHYVNSEAEVLALPKEDIDLARGLFLSQMSGEADPINKIRSYEAMMDLMALQILARLPKNATPEIKIRHMNDFIFDELGFRFPPHSLYAKDIDIYTFLPSVLDSRRGVCLGVSILYICLAQRLDLNLEMITPPGHIYVRYRNGDHIINIETTARGIDMESDAYLGINTRSLEQRDIKEVIGLAHFNQAAVYLYKEDYAKALAAYERAKPYIPNDKLLMELMGFTNLLVGNKAEGTRLLELVKDYTPDHAVYKESMAEDYLKGRVDEEGIRSVFMYVDETRESILKKRDALAKVLEKFPEFRSGYFSLAGTWLQLHRMGEALELIEKYHRFDANDPTAEYYLTVLYAQRMDYNKAWKHLGNAEKIVATRNHDPKTLRDLRRELAHISPE